MLKSFMLTAESVGEDRESRMLKRFELHRRHIKQASLTLECTSETSNLTSFALPN